MGLSCGLDAFCSDAEVLTHCNCGRLVGFHNRQSCTLNRFFILFQLEMIRNCGHFLLFTLICLGNIHSKEAANKRGLPDQLFLPPAQDETLTFGDNLVLGQSKIKPPGTAPTIEAKLIKWSHMSVTL